MAFGNYQDIQFTDFSGGLNTRIDTNLLKDNESPDLQNIVFDGKGSLVPRMGNLIFGATTSASGKVLRTWTTINSLNKEIPMRQCDNNSSSYLEYYNIQTAKWENLDSGYAAGYPLGNTFYDYYNYYCSQKDHLRRWNGAYHTVSAAIGIGHTSCRLTTSAVSTLGFLSAGPLMVDGEEVYYSAISGERFTTTAFVSAHNAGVAITQSPTSALYGWCSATSALPKGDIIKEMDSQMFIAGASGVSGNIVYYSAIDEPWNYTISAAPGGGGSARYPEAGGSITSVTDFDHVLTIMKQNTIRRLKFTEFADGTSGSIEIVEREAILTGNKIGAINNKGVASVENDNSYVSPAGWIKSLSKTVAGIVLTNELSINIRPTVEGMDFSRASSIYYDGKLYVACGTTEASYNNVVFVWDYSFQSWTKFNNWNVNDWFIYDGVLFFGASNEIATYQALYNYDDNGYGYNSYWNSKWFDFGIPHEFKKLGLIYMEGYCTQNTSIGVSAYFDGDTTTPESKTINGNNLDYVTITDTVSMIGMNIWGMSVYGGGAGGSTFNLRKFRWWGRYSGKPFHNVQIKIGTDQPGYVYKITHIIPYLAKIPGKRIPSKSMS